MTDSKKDFFINRYDKLSDEMKEKLDRALMKAGMTWVPCMTELEAVNSLFKNGYSKRNPKHFNQILKENGMEITDDGVRYKTNKDKIKIC